MEYLETDYLVVGAGATGMAFVDELLRQNKRARVILIDRRSKPGGHWVDVYPFVTLHQPALFYGVNSEPLGIGPEDLASGSRIKAYFEMVLEKWCHTKRLLWFPQCDYLGDGRFRSLVASEREYQVKVNMKYVDATYSEIRIPSTHTPNYQHSVESKLVPINHLADLRKAYGQYVVIGAGKTGIDAVIYLLEQGVEAENICWIVSNDSWFIVRDFIKPNLFARELSSQMKVVRGATSYKELFLGYESGGWFFRLDKDIWPTKFRCATVSKREFASLASIHNIVRLGRVKKIEENEIHLENGCIPTNANTLHVDCTANGLTRRPERPVFDAETITLQSVVMCQPVFSAAFIAKIESKYNEQERKNNMCRPVSHPEHTEDYYSCMLTTYQNAESWKAMTWWLLRNRLSFLYHLSLFSHLYLFFTAAFYVKKTFSHMRILSPQSDVSKPK